MAGNISQADPSGPLYTVADYAMRGFEDLAPADQVELLDALEHCLPLPLADHIKAMSFSLRRFAANSAELHQALAARRGEARE